MAQVVGSVTTQWGSRKFAIKSNNLRSNFTVCVCVCVCVREREFCLPFLCSCSFSDIETKYCYSVTGEKKKGRKKKIKKGLWERKKIPESQKFCILISILSPKANALGKSCPWFQFVQL